MATTAQEVFDATMALIDEVNDAGLTDTSDTAEYKNKTLYLLNVLRGELYPYSDNFRTCRPGKRPIAKLIENFDSNIALDDYICQSVMPYGLAALLLVDENPSVAQFMNEKYEDLRDKLARGMPQGSEEIEDVLGGIGFSGGGRWG